MRAGNTPEVERKTPVHPQVIRLSALVPACVRDLRSRRRRSSPRRPPRPQAAGSGGEVRGAQCAARPGKRPVRGDFTRQECAPPPPPPHGGRPRVSSAPRPRNAPGSAADSHSTVGAAGPAPTPGPAPRSPRPERRLEAPSVGEPPGPRGSGARRTSAPQGGGGGRRAGPSRGDRKRRQNGGRPFSTAAEPSQRGRELPVERLRAAAFPNSPQ